MRVSQYLGMVIILNFLPYSLTQANPSDEFRTKLGCMACHQIDVTQTFIPKNSIPKKKPSKSHVQSSYK